MGIPFMLSGAASMSSYKRKDTMFGLV